MQRHEAVRFWLKKDVYASWRRLIRRLDKGGESELAQNIHSFAEKVTGKSYREIDKLTTINYQLHHGIA